MNTLLRRLQRGILVLLVVWVAIHTVLVWRTSWTPWRWGGFGMYSEQEAEHRAAAIVACEQPRCNDERADVAHFAPLRDIDVPVVQPTESGVARYRLVSSQAAQHGELATASLTFKRMPTRWHAEGLVRARLSTPCGPYLVVLFIQDVSMITRNATVDSRSFVVSLPPERCDGEQRLT